MKQCWQQNEAGLPGHAFLAGAGLLAAGSWAASGYGGDGAAALAALHLGAGPPSL